MHAVRYETGQPQWASLILAGGVILGVVGPFDQVVRFGVFERIGLWVLYMAIGLPVFWRLHHMTVRCVNGAGHAARIIRIVLTVVAGCWPMLLAIELLGMTQGRPVPATLEALLRAASEVCFVAAPIVGVMDFCIRPLRSAAGGSSNSGEQQSAPSARNHPLGAPAAPEFGGVGELFAVQAEGHYARAYGSKGDKLLDLSFSEALDLVRELDGARVHRSWWVARAYAKCSAPSGSSVALMLPCGNSAPVARRRRALLKAAGWPV